MKLAACLALLVCLLGAACARQQRGLLAPTPTQKINAERQQQQVAAAQQAAAARGPSGQQRLKPPCFIPDQYYPYQTCKLSQDPASCGKGFNAWPTYEQCCAKQRGPIGAFVGGCTDFNKNVTCYVAGTYYPTQQCRQSSELAECTRNWGRWSNEADCCKPGAAFADGCSQPQPCWVADAWFPARTCGLTEDRAVCERGWGAFQTQEECCAPNAAHSQGCGAVDMPAAEDGENAY